MISDGMQIDHLRTCGMIFRRGLLEKSVAPITLYVGEPGAVRDYHSMVRGQYSITPGWQNIHAIRKSYEAVPAGQAAEPWLNEKPTSPLVSDTKQIVKDLDRKQLTVASAQAEAFSGMLGAEAPAGLKHLELSGEGFATVVLVADDSKDLSSSARLVLSRTNVDSANAETEGPGVALAGMALPQDAKKWQFRVTRPREMAGATEELVVDGNGRLVLPDGGWHEGELELR